MNTLNETLSSLSSHESITLYQNVNLKTLYKGIGRVIGNFNKELLEVLKITNGASILDYCLLGFKNSQLGTDIDKFTMELWHSNDLLAGKMIPFMIDSSGGTFGYLINEFIKPSQSAPIIYYSDLNPEYVYVIGSSFMSFFTSFLEDVKYTINNNKDGLLVSIEIEDWPLDISHWIKNDSNLLNTFEEINIKEDGILKL